MFVTFEVSLISGLCYDNFLKSRKFSGQLPPEIVNIQRSISFWQQTITVHVVNFPRKWPTSPMPDYRVPRLLRELINDVTSSRKHFYLHLSPQPPWHITICLTKAEFSESSFESNVVWSVLFAIKILYTWRHVLWISKKCRKNIQNRKVLKLIRIS